MEKEKKRLRTLASQNLDAKALYERLAIHDIQAAADGLRPVYEKTQKRDGYVSLEVSPYLARDTQGTLAEARRWWQAVGRENLMIKVPATREGIPAIEPLIREGINVNVTLLFSPAVYEQVVAAYMAGLEKRAAQGGYLSPVASGASFFVSRIDSAIDAVLTARRGVWGLERGYCLMIGGSAEAVRQLDPIFQTLAPGRGAVARTPGREGAGGTAEEGYLHCGPSGAGHFVKMVHNGIEYGLMAAYAEGLNILHHANVGQRERAVDAETAPLRNPEHYQYDFPLADIAEVWRRGSVVASWLLDLTATALLEQPDLANFSGRVADSGEGRWTIAAAIEEGCPAPVLSAALYERFRARGEGDFAARVLSAQRLQFGGHTEKK